jgi:chemotaxis protein methyltransferase CheR
MRANADATCELGAAEFRRFQDLAYRQAGIRLAEAKLPLVQNRLARRLRATGDADYPAYLARIGAAEGADELARCIEALTTNETFFFRHKDHWDFLIAEVLASWPAGRPLRLWSAAASTGEEAHSAAIACLEHAPEARAAIEASDINRQVIEVARRGVYGDYAVQKVTEWARRRWFQRFEDGWRVAERARAAVTWRVHNLMQPAHGPKVDVVFLRNVLIYFDEASKARALANVAARMERGAWLLLGGSESLPGDVAGFLPVRPQIYRKA